MNSRMALLTLAVFAVGVFAMPNTLSLFSGQHTFSNNGSDDYFCIKCHSDVYVEMNWYGGGDPPDGAHAAFDNCKVCHRTGSLNMPFGVPGKGDMLDADLNPNPNYTNPTVNYSNQGLHAAITVECVFCHDLIPAQINGTGEAHRDFYDEANQSSLLKGGNEACVGCHTRTTTAINYVRKGGLNITADITSGSWNVALSINQTDVNSTVVGQ